MEHSSSAINGIKPNSDTPEHIFMFCKWKSGIFR